MEEVARRPSVEYIPQKVKTTSYTKITPDTNGYERGLLVGSTHPFVLNTKSPTTVFLAAHAERDPRLADAVPPPTSNDRHVVTIRINSDTDKAKPKISSVHLKSETDFDHFKFTDVKKNNSLVRINVDENLPKIVEHDELRSIDKDKPPYIYCNAYGLSSTNMVMSSGQCSPSDTLDSGTCSDLDSTPPPLQKKKTKTNKKAVTVTLIGNTNNHPIDEVDFADNDSNISCDSLNSSELSGSVHADESQIDDAGKKEKKSCQPYSSDVSNDDSFLPRGLLQDIRDRSAKLNTVETESGSKNDEEAKLNINRNANLSKESADLTSFRLVNKLSDGNSYAAAESTTPRVKSPVIIESTYEDRRKSDMKQKKCYSGDSFDSDKFYEFHLNEKNFDDEVKSVKSTSGKDGDGEEVEYFAGIKDFKCEDVPSTIRSSKGTIRGVKNRVRAGIATFLQIQTTTKSYKEKDAGKVVIYTTTMGIVRNTYQRCVLVKKILRNLLVKYEERDVFMSTEYQDEIRDRMKSDEILVPQLFVDGQHVGDADTVEKLNESGDLRKMLKPYKSPDACNTCQMCGGFRLLPCRICNGSKKSLHRNHFTTEFVALKCMNCDEVGLVKCEACC